MGRAVCINVQQFKPWGKSESNLLKQFCSSLRAARELEISIVISQLPELSSAGLSIKNKCKTIYWKTGHSHIKRKVYNEKALAGFEKSGHFFFNKPLGYGYDDGINSAIQVCHLLNKQNQKLSKT